jgi:hypothetical protein
MGGDDVPCMTLDVAIADLLALEGSGADFKPERVLSVAASYIAGLGFGAREHLADEFERRVPKTDRTASILKNIRDGEKSPNGCAP